MARVWRLAEALAQLRDQINEAWPDRSRRSDGTIGDAAHQKRPSDHNPNQFGVVTAFDITHDPANGCDVDALFAAIVASRDPRVKYLIRNRKILTPRIGWHWRDYTGSNPHTAHGHVSVAADPKLFDDRSPWKIGVAVEDEMLKRGDKGNPVAWFQQQLNKLPVVSPKLKVDGDFGAATEAAVKQVQAHWQFPQTGRWGPVEAMRLALVLANDSAGRAIEAAVRALPPGGGLSQAQVEQIVRAALERAQFDVKVRAQ